MSIMLLKLSLILFGVFNFTFGRGTRSGNLLAPNLNSTNNNATRNGKIFSLFSVVQFKNTGCRSQSALASGQSAFRNGTCYTGSECNIKGGSASGNCAAGFGVCCLFMVSSSGATISQNCTYIRNPGFPSAYSSTSAVTFNLAKCVPGVCSLRLDFESFTILGPTLSTEVGGGVCPDTFKITTTTGQVIPNICGMNSGQHIYIDVGNQATDTATIAFAFSGSSTTRLWEIKVTQIECWNPSKPPQGCLQYFTTPTGRITTFNFLPTTGSSHLANQDYSTCIKSQSGYCCIQYQVCPSVINAFSLDAVPTMGLMNQACSQDYVGIPNSSSTCASSNSGTVSSKYCGSYINQFGSSSTNIPICDCTSPFYVHFRTDALTDAAAGGNTPTNIYSRGVCLDYQYLPCVN